MNIVWHCQSNCSDHVPCEPDVPEVPPKDVPQVPEVPHVPDSIQSCLASSYYMPDNNVARTTGETFVLHLNKVLT